jgi:DNA-binding NtrC family response regulator
MPATRRPTDTELHHQLVLILSPDPLAAALLGALVETLGYEVQFQRPPESPEDSLRRVRARICLVDCGDPYACREDFFGRATMRGVCVVIFGTREALERVRDVAAAHRIEMLLMPPDVDELAAALQRAGGE